MELVGREKSEKSEGFDLGGEGMRELLALYSLNFSFQQGLLDVSACIAYKIHTHLAMQMLELGSSWIFPFLFCNLKDSKVISLID